jgi:hypothetical protein
LVCCLVHLLILVGSFEVPMPDFVLTVFFFSYLILSAPTFYPL